MLTKTPVGQHERRFNAPTVDEVAILLAGDQTKPRDIVLCKRDSGLKRIHELNQSYDCLQYPLLFAKGEFGYSIDLKQVDPTNSGEPSNKNLSAKDFYAYRIMFRQGSCNHLLKCKQLFNQFLTDMHAKIESERLSFLRSHQKQIRAEEYKVLKDAMSVDGDPANLGKLTILPSSFTCSPRWYNQKEQDAMTYVRMYGTPDLFLTFTCNPHWKEIQDELFQGQVASDRYDIISRVFHLKHNKLMERLTKGQVFGPHKCFIYSIEWQKRGLPHSHTLLWLENPIRPDQIDEVVCAELPDKDIDPELFEIVTSHMIHGPCGEIDRRSVCMKDNKCTKKYPRPLVHETQMGEDSYPTYRRRPGHFFEKKVKGNIVEIDNKWVVPHNKFLLKTFNAHLNVEICSSVKSIKYVCKYITKGSDLAIFSLQDDKRPDPFDEISTYEIGRYISSGEAVWRILGFPVHERSPSVEHLAVHLENGQRVYFNPNDQNLGERLDAPPQTTLTAFFKLCSKDDFASTLFYAEVPQHYTWQKSRKVWQRRATNQKSLGRMYTVHPSNRECYFLRILLHHKRGPKSFDDLKTIEGEVCQTFQEACIRLGLLHDDSHWNAAMEEAAFQMVPKRIRELFAVILTACEPLLLWENHKESMAEDFVHRVRLANPDGHIDFNETIFNEALIAIEDHVLEINSKKTPRLWTPYSRQTSCQHISEGNPKGDHVQHGDTC